MTNAALPVTRIWPSTSFHCSSPRRLVKCASSILRARAHFAAISGSVASCSKMRTSASASAGPITAPQSNCCTSRASSRVSAMAMMPASRGNTIEFAWNNQALELGVKRQPVRIRNAQRVGKHFPFLVGNETNEPSRPRCLTSPASSLEALAAADHQEDKTAGRFAGVQPPPAQCRTRGPSRDYLE